jgi:hypothetical protein
MPDFKNLTQSAPPQNFLHHVNAKNHLPNPQIKSLFPNPVGQHVLGGRGVHPQGIGGLASGQ